MRRAVGWSARSKSGASSVAFSPDGARLLAGGYNAVKLWDVASGQLVLGVKTPSPDLVAFSPDGSKLLAFVTRSAVGQAGQAG